MKQRRTKVKQTEALKDLAADHWHGQRLDAVFGADYEKCFKLHEIAFIAGYRAALPPKRRRKS